MSKNDGKSIKTVRFTVGETANALPEGLFGMNMEITRKAVFGGLSAQMLNNRKFFAAGADGMPCGWKITKGRLVTDDPGSSVCGSNYAVLEPGGELVCEQELYFKAGRKYTLSVCAGAETDGKNPAAEPGRVSITAGGRRFRTAVPFRTGTVLRDRVLRYFKPAETTAKGVFRIKNISKNTPVSVFTVSLMPAGNYNGMRRDAVRLLKELKPSYLRYPGGCCADHFDWDTAFLEPDLRRPITDNGTKWFLFPDTYGQDCCDLGPAEFLRLAKYVGAEPEFTVGIVDGMPEKAVAAVKHLKNDRYGKAVRRWYIGNEPYYFGGEYADGKKAAEMCDRYAAAMRAADPGIKLIGGLCSDFYHDEWDRAFVENSKTVYDEISFHNYCGAATDTVEQDIKQKEAVSRIFRNGENARLDRIKSDFLKNGWDAVKINVDEWNLTWGQYGSTLMMLAVALMTHFLIKSYDRYHVSDARYFHPVNEGLIRVTPEKAYLDTAGILFRHMNVHRGGLVANVICDDESADVCATVHPDYVAVSAVNRGGVPLRLSSDSLKGAEITRLTFESCSSNDDRVTVVNEKADGDVVLGPYEAVFAVKR